MAVTSMILAPGTMLGGYRVGDVIGLGGMAVVYRAEQVALGRSVALKVLSTRLAKDDAFRERFRREGKHVAVLDHPNVVSIYDSGEADGHLYLAMRLVTGSNLAEQMDEQALSAEETIRILVPIAAALDAAHAEQLVHRDVKPQNILLGKDGHPYLADFGVAKGRQTGGLTATGGFVGSFNYAAPEQFMNREVTPATDVYSLCAVLFQCLTGQVPYPRDTDAGVLSAHVTEPPPAVRIEHPACEAINAVFARGMAKDPVQRHARASELIAAAIDGLSTLAPERMTVVPAFLPVESAAERRWAALPDSLGADLERGNERSPEAPIGPPAAAEEGNLEPRVEDPVSGADSASAAGSGSLRTADRTEILARSNGMRARIGGATAADRRVARLAPPAPAEEPAESRRRRVMFVGFGVMLAFVAAGAWLITTSGSGKPSRIGHSGPLSVSYAAPWRAVREPARIASLVKQPVVLGRDGTTFVAGPLGLTASTLGGAPPAMKTRFGNPRTVTTARLDGHPARLYSWLPKSGGSVTALVLSTMRFDLAVICAGATRSDSPNMCASLTAHTNVSGVTILAPGPDAALSAQLVHVIKSVTPLRVARNLTGTFAHRMKVALTISRAERLAAVQIGRIVTPDRYHEAMTGLAFALDREADAFSALASAASRAQREAYNQARPTIASAGQALATAIKTLDERQVRIPALSPLRAPPAPAQPKSATNRSEVSTGSPSDNGGSLIQQSVAGQTPVTNTHASTPLTTAHSGTPVTTSHSNTPVPTTTSHVGAASKPSGTSSGNQSSGSGQQSGSG